LSDWRRAIGRAIAGAVVFVILLFAAVYLVF
jgi:hypothetical protein